MKVISLINTQSNVKKIFKGLPPEDFAYKAGDAFTVCDGVTLLHYDPYPIPSPAAAVARLTAKTIVGELNRKNFKRKSSLHRAFRRANAAIMRYNRRIGLTSSTVDFLRRQFAATVCAFGRIVGNQLYWGQITDCGVMVLDRSGQVVMNKILDRRPIDRYVSFLRRRYGFRADSREEYQYFRREVVNNPNIHFQGQQIRWGVMTGEPRAVKFLQTGRITLQPGWNVIFYTDGMIPLLKLRACRKLIARRASKRELVSFMKKKESTGRRFQSERTMVVVSFRST
jgi:hypothetical protein